MPASCMVRGARSVRKSRRSSSAPPAATTVVSAAPLSRSRRLARTAHGTLAATRPVSWWHGNGFVSAQVRGVPALAASSPPPPTSLLAEPALLARSVLAGPYACSEESYQRIEALASALSRRVMAEVSSYFTSCTAITGFSTVSTAKSRPDSSGSGFALGNHSPSARRASTRDCRRCLCSKQRRARGSYPSTSATCRGQATPQRCCAASTRVSAFSVWCLATASGPSQGLPPPTLPFVVTPFCSTAAKLSARVWPT